ncbi:MmcQ/YjbR family DNA-binding protein [Capnocytophaga sp.]|uniref:MmcQ/YjbR family DNA-binding protein n=1 Tax=Capnocytophaga sp. TaxID=44737 RepID=UPI0026DCBB5A|nr:MmcQ/YjbR family DNA-binding protein [Capnocytophaga sp.]MDO5105603.1 MmcQ/YjbR family DNA-binding protein [Capnocytophaga sp.]
MNIGELREFCLSLKAAEEGFPFDDEILVFSVKGKMFCLVNIVKNEFINLKCDPDEAVELREQYAEVTAGWHMNKKHWNSIRIDGKIPHKLLKTWIVNSYDLVVKGLPKKVQEELSEM